MLIKILNIFSTSYVLSSGIANLGREMVLKKAKYIIKRMYVIKI